MNGTLIPRFLVIFVLFMTGCGSTASETKHASSLSNDLIDAAIERYIRTHSKVIVQSLQAMEAKRKAEQRVCQKTSSLPKQRELICDSASPVSDNPKGEITRGKFYDYRCGYCKQAVSAVMELQKQDPRIRVVYKDFPILGEPSVLAAKATFASQAQGKHQTFDEALLTSHGGMTKEEILKIAVSVGLNTKRFEAEMANPKW